MSFFTDIFIKKPVLALVINIIILAVGWQAVDKLAVRQYPRIESTSIIINTYYIGGSAETIRGFITVPIERAVSAIDGIDYIESESNAGVSTITIRLRLNHDANAALAQVSARLNQVRSELPAEAESPVVDIQRADRPYATFYLSFTSDEISLTRLNDYLVREIQPELATLQGVQRVGVEGKRDLAMRVWLDLNKLTGLDITPTDVFDALRRNNFIATVGRTKNEHMQVDLLTDTDLRTPEQFQKLIVRDRDGSVVRLRDVATVELGSEEPLGEAGYNLKPALYLSVWPLASANEIEVSDRLQAAMKTIKPKLPPGVDMTLAYDGTYYMRNAIKEISKTLVETLAIVSLVVFLFMGSLRTVLVPLIAMPVSLMGAAVFMVLMGFSLNLLTILAIVLSVGLVVDDAIVMVENVERHIREGKGRIEAALVGARELLAPVISMTITLAAVYAPIGFQSGLTGVLFREFAFTLAAAVVVSGITALTLSPIMSAYLTHEHGHEGWFTRVVNSLFDKLRNVYAAALNITLTLRWSIGFAAIIIALCAVPLYMFSGQELAPTEDEGGVFFIIQAAPDSSLEATRKSATEVAAVLQNVPEASFTWRVLMSPSFGFGGMQTKPWNERKRTTREILPQAYGMVSSIKGVQAIPVLPPPLPGAGNFDVELIVTSTESPERMAQYAQQLVGSAFGSGKFMYADTDIKIDLPQTRIIIDRDRVADLGLDVSVIGRDLSTMLSGMYANRFNFDGQSYKVIPQVADTARATPEDILQMKVRTASGGLVSVNSFVRLETIVAPRSLKRFQQRSAFRINGVVLPGITKADALATLEAKAREILPVGYDLDYAGESRQLKHEGSSLAATLGFALCLIYLVLAAQFGSFRDPLIVLLGSVPLAITGSLVFTFLGWTTINIYSQVGLITLVGLVAKNGILIVEFANHLQEQGLSKHEAAREAAVTRFRPILMTSVATVVGHFPLVLVTGAGALARNSIGIVLVSGMLISTLFTLFFVPSIYTLIAGRRQKHTAAHAAGESHAPPAKTAPAGA